MAISDAGQGDQRKVCPFITPNVFNGDSSVDWDDWIDHFESVSRVNGWDDDTRLLWLEVRLTGKARNAWKCLSHSAKQHYNNAKVALQRRFEPESRRELYFSQFQTKKRDSSETWAELADNLRLLADKAFPELNDHAKEQLSLDRYLALLDRPDLALLVRQRRPKSINDAVSYTLEIESHMLITEESTCHFNSGVTASDDVPSTETQPTYTATVEVKQDTMIDLIRTITTRLDSLERKLSASMSGDRKGKMQFTRDQRSTTLVSCRKCGRDDHFTRGCAANRGTDCKDLEKVNDAKDQLLKSTAEQSQHGESSKNSNSIKLSAVTPTCAYHVIGEFSNGKIQFMIDTGAAVSLIRADAWKPAVGSQPTIFPWTGCQLVGVEGSKIGVKGVSTLKFTIAGVMVEADFLITEQLSSEAILGLDFLEQYQCVINADQHTLHLQGKAVPLCGGTRRSNNTEPLSLASVVTPNNLQIPPLSEVEIIAPTSLKQADESPSSCAFLVETVNNRPPIVVANAIVAPRVECSQELVVPIRLLNPSSKTVTIYKGTKIAHISPLMESELILNVNPSQPNEVHDVSPAAQEALWQLVENSGEVLDSQQQRQLYQLLLIFCLAFHTVVQS